MPHIFHLAIPAKDLSSARDFYVSGLGCRLARSYEDRITLEFFGHQVVCHLSDKIDPTPTMYPRHFGLTFTDEHEFESILEKARAATLSFFQEPFVRFPGKTEEHRSFMLRDPSNNLIEFKWYKDREMMY
jgi:extradiol dioxygenase family protein